MSEDFPRTLLDLGSGLAARRHARNTSQLCVGRADGSVLGAQELRLGRFGGIAGAAIMDGISIWTMVPAITTSITI